MMALFCPECGGARYVSDGRGSWSRCEACYLLSPPPPAPPPDEEPLTLHDYAFDVKLFAVIRVQATSEAEARKLIKDHVQAAGVVATDLPDNIALTEFSCDDGEDELFSIDGKAI